MKEKKGGGRTSQCVLWSRGTSILLVTKRIGWVSTKRSRGGEWTSTVAGMELGKRSRHAVNNQRPILWVMETSRNRIQTCAPVGEGKVFSVMKPKQKGKGNRIEKKKGESERQTILRGANRACLRVSVWMYPYERKRSKRGSDLD